MNVPALSTPLNLKSIPKQSPRSSKHPVPRSDSLKPAWQMQYAPSKDGQEINLLIMLHGMGE